MHFDGIRCMGVVEGQIWPGCFLSWKHGRLAWHVCGMLSTWLASSSRPEGFAELDENWTPKCSTDKAWRETRVPAFLVPRPNIAFHEVHSMLAGSAHAKLRETCCDATCF